MYLNGMGFRAIARVTEIDHTTIINWVEEAGESLSDEPQDSEIPEITEIDELQTFVGNKNNKLWIWTVVNHHWQIIKCWHSFWYVTDGWKVYPMYIQLGCIVRLFVTPNLFFYSNILSAYYYTI